MDEPTTKPSGSKPASPSSAYSDTDRSEVNTAPGSAPAVWASRLSAACGSQVCASSGLLLPNRGMVPPVAGVPRPAGAAGCRAQGSPGHGW